ncbi:hypothetical protein M1329_02250 [Candidatus Marsarchaeota archaeon]|nr:hypothetical protein [Candidatus Marsarchaeota archaeon]MCL5100179.1 hypothetical protein [Candidatus Marsarchaeota archaeon]
MIRYVLSKNAKILFVGINPHYGSYSRGVPFSNNKMFWYLLNRSGIIHEDIAQLRDDRSLKQIYTGKFLPVYNLNFTNIVTRPSRNVSQLRRGEEEAGRKRVLHFISVNNPKVVCFIGKITYSKFKGSDGFKFGWQENIHNSRAYVMHFPIRGRAVVRIKELRGIDRVARHG